MPDDEEKEPAPEAAPATPDKKTKKNGHALPPAAPAGLGSALFQRKEIPPAKTTDALGIWEEICEELRSKGRHPSEILIRVTRLEPPPEMPMGTFSGDAVCTGEDPSGELFAFMANYFHAKSPLKSGPAKYRIQFRGRGNTFSRWAELTMPAPDELVHLGQPRGYGMPGAMNQPPGYAQSPYPVSPYPYPQYRHDVPSWGAPQPASQPQAQPAASAPPPTAPGQSGEVAELRAQVGFLSGQLAEVIKALQEGRAPVAASPAPTPPPAAPAVPPHLRETIEFLKELGFVRPATAAAAIGVGAPAAPAAPAAAVAQVVPVREASMLTEAATAVKTLKALKGLAQEVETLFGGESADEPPPAPGLGLPIVEENDTDEKLPFVTIPVPDIKLGEHPVAYARDRKTGTLSLEGTIFSNPVIAEKVLDLGATIIKAAAKMSGVKGAEEMVPKVERTVGGVPVQQLPAQQQAPAQAPASSQGWPTL